MKEEVVKNGVPPCVLIPTNHNNDDDDDYVIDDVDVVKDYLSCVKAREGNPIAAFREAFGYTSDEEDEDDQMGALVMALAKTVRDDDMPNFVTKLNLLFDLYAQPSKTMYPKFCTNIILEWICEGGATKCATALLQGQTCVSVDLNVPCDFVQRSYPLHLSAVSLYYDLVKLFLSHGARTDVTRYAKGKKSLPISVAVISLFGLKSPLEWCSEESIYKLVIALCLPRMKVALATVKLLASRTKDEDVNDVFILHAREGDVGVMAALLITASEHIMAPSVIQSEDSDIDAGGVAILNIFVRAGDAIRSYLSSRLSQASKEEVVKDVASILREAGFGLDDKDIDFIGCESNEIEEATQTRDDIIPCKPTTTSFRFFNGPSVELFRGTKQGSAVKNFDRHWYVPGRCISISQLLRFHETPGKGENYAMQRCMTTSKPNNLLVSLASSIRRGMRRI